MIFWVFILFFALVVYYTNSSSSGLPQGFDAVIFTYTDGCASNTGTASAKTITFILNTNEYEINSRSLTIDCSEPFVYSLINSPQSTFVESPTNTYYYLLPFADFVGDGTSAYNTIIQKFPELAKYVVKPSAGD